MPQIFSVVSSKVVLSNEMKRKIKGLRAIVEEKFNIIGRKDVAVTTIQADDIEDEADIQIEIRYTAGTDEYIPGKIFDPQDEVKESLCNEIKRQIQSTYPTLSVSVWCMPFYKTLFKFYPAKHQ